MNVWPVITRELRAQARQKFTYSLRALGVLALLSAGAVFAVEHPFTPNLGGALFGYLHVTLFGAIWILVPLSAADCISRERREGTLGLLFLTPLKPAAIVIAKGIAHGLRAVTLLVAALPVLTIPFLLGGVRWQLAAMSALINFSSICWSLAAALVASSSSRSGLRAMVGAVLLEVFAFFIFAYVLGSSVLSVTRRPVAIFPGIDYTWLSMGGLMPAYFTSNFFVAPPALLLMGSALAAGISLLALLLAIWIAGRQIRRSWREEPPPAWMLSVQKTFCTPVLWLTFFRRWMRWKLERNPIGWLGQRSWTGRLVTWSWFAIIISVYSAVLTDRNFFRNFHDLQLIMAWLLMGSISASAAGSFRRERETGVLELLLVAPLTTNQIIGGRLRGLWGQFLPAVGILLGIWLYFAGIFKRTTDAAQVQFFFITFLTLPVIGLYFSVRCRNFLSAFLLTVTLGVGLPLALQPVLMLLASLLGFLFRNSLIAGFLHLTYRVRLMPGLIQILVALDCFTRLQRRLARRDFPLERTVS